MCRGRSTGSSVSRRPIQGWGNALELFTELSWYDNTVHVTLPMSLAPIIYLALSRIDVVPDPCDRAGARA
jgi:hypothetical protein